MVLVTLLIQYLSEQNVGESLENRGWQVQIFTQYSVKTPLPRQSSLTREWSSVLKRYLLADNWSMEFRSPYSGARLFFIDGRGGCKNVHPGVTGGQREGIPTGIREADRAQALGLLLVCLGDGVPVLSLIHI